MKQIPPTKNIYHVCTKEKVKLVFTPFAGASPAMITIAHAGTPGNNGVPLDPDSDFPETPTFRFTISQPVGGTETVVYVCSFSGETTEDTRFELTLEGSKGQQKKLQGPTVFSDDNVKMIALAFDVRASC
jgi:hypothetical protein